jgi:hypothetical protein
MTFGLKNAGATYQRAMNFIFHEFIGKLVEIYIDDVVVKSGDFTKHLADLRKVLECTRKHGLKMNPNKCAFGVSAGQFLGFMVHQRGIEISRRSIDAINKIVAPTNKTELQSLIGKVNFIRRFISNLSGKIRAFSPLLKLKADQEFVWGKEQQLALDEINNRIFEEGGLLMAVAALITWLVTAGGGFVMLGIWLSKGGHRPGGGSRLAPALVFGHFALAVAGLLLWIGFLATDEAGLAWAAFAVLLPVALLGFTMLFRWLPARRAGTVDSRLPIPVVAAHGLFAATTLVLVLLAALGAGES